MKIQDLRIIWQGHVTSSSLHPGPRRVMGGRMIRMAMALFSGFLALSQARADLSPDNWQLQSIDGAGASSVWHFWPDGMEEPRILSKSISNNNLVNWALLSGEPPQWTLGGLNEVTGINKEGVFIPTGDNSGYLIGIHLNGGAHYLRCLSFVNGMAATEVVDPTGAIPFDSDNPGISRISAAVDNDDNLHVAYVRRAGAADEVLCYARKPFGGEWTRTALALNGSFTAQVKGTAITATTLNDVRLYFTLATAQYTTLWRATPQTYQGVLLIQHLTFPMGDIDTPVDFSIAAYRDATGERVYYFGVPTATTRTLKRSAGVSTGTPIQSDIPAVAGLAVLPRSIHEAVGPDGRKRVAWYDGRGKRIHYLRPAAPTGTAYNSGQPVQFSGVGTLPDANLLGFYFTPSGVPCLLCRRAMTEGYVAFPKDDFDLNGNGRDDIFDAAFNSASAGFTPLPINPTEKRLKLTFPTIGSSVSTNTDHPGAVVSIQENLKYAIQVSTNLESWTTLNSSSLVTYSFVSTGGSNPNQRRTFTATLNQEAPGNTSIRFARLAVTRIAQPLY